MSRVAEVAAVVLAAALSAHAAVAQSPEQSAFEVQPNYPNPFVSETTIPFTLSEVLFADDEPAVVTVSVFDVFARLVAHPVALDHPSGPVQVNSLAYGSPGQYEAFWDGTDETGAPVGAAIYVLEMSVNGERLVRRMVRAGEALSSGPVR